MTAFSGDLGGRVFASYENGAWKLTAPQVMKCPFPNQDLRSMAIGWETMIFVDATSPAYPQCAAPCSGEEFVRRPDVKLAAEKIRKEIREKGEFSQAKAWLYWRHHEGIWCLVSATVIFPEDEEFETFVS